MCKTDGVETLVVVSPFDGSNKYWIELISTNVNIRCLDRYRHVHTWSKCETAHVVIQKMRDQGVDLKHVEQSKYWDIMMTK